MKGKNASSCAYPDRPPYLDWARECMLRQQMSSVAAQLPAQPGDQQPVLSKGTEKKTYDPALHEVALTEDVVHLVKSDT